MKKGTLKNQKQETEIIEMSQLHPEEIARNSFLQSFILLYVQMLTILNYKLNKREIISCDFKQLEKVDFNISNTSFKFQYFFK